MNLHTEVHITPSSRPLRHHDRILMLGSCFAENIAVKLQNGGFRCTSNPFGVLYNPMSISACLNRLLSNEPFTEADLTEYGGLYHSMLHHGSFSAAAPRECLQRLNDALQIGHRALQEADVIIITWGTAWIYEMEGRIVANCHKMPASCFTRRRLTGEEIAEHYRQLLALPQMQGKQIILTVSPIRHIKDGLHENQLSKATLLLAADQLTREAGCTYFPSYEIQLDELRDYRFYADDMLHPSAVAVDYIWEQFARTQLSEEARQAAAECEAYMRARAHRPLHPDDPACLRFAESLEQKRQALLRKYPYLEI